MILISDINNILGNSILSAFINRHDPEKIRIMSEDEKEWPEKYKKQLPQIEKVVATTDNAKSLKRAMENVDCLMITASNLFTDHREDNLNLIRCARKAQVKELLFISTVNTGQSESLPARENQETERIVRQSGIPYLILRVNLLMEQLPLFIGDTIQTHTLYFPAGTGKVSFISASDVARAVQTLHIRHLYTHTIYTLSHSISHSFADIADMLTLISGMFIRYEHLENEVFRTAMTNLQLPEAITERLCHIASAIENNEYDVPDTTLHRLIKEGTEDEKSKKRGTHWWEIRKKKTNEQQTVKPLVDYLKESYML